MNKTKTTTIQTPTLSEIVQGLQLLTEQVAKLAHEPINGRHARGTEAPATKLRENDLSATPLYAKVRELITERPMPFRALLEATHATDNQIKSVLIRLQRDRHDVVNLGNGARALWFIPDAAVLERLKHVKTKANG